MRKIIIHMAVIVFFLYVFIDFNNLFTAENVKNAGNAKTKIVSTTILFLTKSKVGYYIVRFLPLAIAVTYTYFIFKKSKK